MDRLVANQLLNALPTPLRAELLRGCEHVTLVPGQVLARPGETIGSVDFVESGFVSIVASEAERDQVEIALVGREGMCGVTVALGGTESPFRVLVQGAGSSYRMPARAFQNACASNPALQRVALTYSQAFLMQVAETSRANARQSLESRLARWLLMAHDRSETDDLSITHEMLSLMLGVRRPGVTVSLHVLEGERMIKARRGTIRILDRAKLEAAAKGAYGPAEAACRRLFSGWTSEIAVAA